MGLKEDIAIIEATYARSGNPALGFDLMAIIRSLLDASGVADLVISDADTSDIRAALAALDAGPALLEAFASLGGDQQTAVLEVAPRLAAERDAWVANIDGGATIDDLQVELESTYGYIIPEES